MATYDKGKCLTLIAGEDLTGKMYHAVKLNSDGEVILGTAAANAVGILYDEGEEGEAVSVMINGTSPFVAGGEITAGSTLTPDASGHLVVSSLATDALVGLALEAGSAGQQLEMIVGGQSSAGIAGLGKADTVISFPVKLATLDNADIVTDLTLGFAGKIKAINFITTVAASTAAKTLGIHAEIGATATTGGVVALTTAGINAIGKVVAGSAITAENTFLANSTISIVAEDTATAFVEGEGIIQLVIEQ